MASISIKGLRSKDPLLHEYDFYKPLEAEPLATISEKKKKNIRLEGRHLSIWDPASPNFRL